jgi:23S rRNA (uridine2552-2'-O)-methyltransferase
MTYRRRDVYHRRARAEGYRARSAYKLAELDRRFGLLARGQRVVDLGAWPGGWLQVALDRIGREGRLVGVDLTPIAPLAAPNVVLLAADVRAPGLVAEVLASLGGQADVVLSDLAPKLSGVRATDEAHAAELAATTLGLLPALLRPGGSLLTKLFMGPDYQTLVDRVRGCFAQVRTTRPEATRRGSAELYLVGSDYSPGRPASCG